MAYRKYARKRRSSRRNKRRSGITTASALQHLGGTALKILKNKLGLNTEMKYFDSAVQTGTVTSTATGLTIPTTVAQGLTNTTRTGDGIRLVSYKFSLQLSAATAAVRTAVTRVYLVKFKDSRGATMASDVFLDDPTSTLSFLNMGNTTSGTGYTIIKEWTLPIQPVVADNSIKQIDFTWRPFQHHVKWIDSDTTGASNNIIDGLFGLFIHSNAANPPTFTLNQRIRFVDN